MRSKLLLLSMALVWIGAPLPGALAGEACPPCCPQAAEAPCGEADAPCASFAATPCCEAAPAAPTVPAKRSVEAPSFHPVATAFRAPAPAAALPLPPMASGDLALLSSPLRLSVVLKL